MHQIDSECHGVFPQKGPDPIRFQETLSLTNPRLSHPCFLGPLDITPFCSQNEKIAHGNCFFAVPK